MARKKTKRKTNKVKSKQPFLSIDWFYNLEEDTQKEILALGCLILGIFFVLIILGSGGVVGSSLFTFFTKTIGWSIYTLPVIFILLGLINYSTEENTFDSKTFWGIIISILSISALIHTTVPLDNDTALDFGIDGKFGGYLGFLATFLFRYGLGDAFTYIIFTILVFTGLFMTFKLSIGAIINAISEWWENIGLEPEYETSRRNTKKSTTTKSNKLKEVLPEEMPIKKGKLFEQKTISSAELIIKTPEIEPSKKKKMTKKVKDSFQVHTDKIEGYEAPQLNLMDYTIQEYKVDEEELKRKAQVIRDKLEKFDIHVEMHDVNIGPTVIQYTMKPGESVKLSKIESLEKDIALALAAHSLRIEAPIPGKSLVGIELPNEHRIVVRMRDLFESDEYSSIKSNMRLVLGRDVAGRPFIQDMKSMPHLLVAGQTGSGKSVGINSVIISLLYQNSPNDMRFIMIDPKQVELGVYNHIPHLLTPIISEIDKAISSLKWTVNEMEKRYKLMKEAKVREIDEYNAQVEDKEDKMFKIVIIIDEMADLMMQAGKEAEQLIVRLAQKARATGIHLVLATQRPSVNVVTGLIKANMPSRIAFTTASIVDSKTVLDYGGAEKLLNKGDMLYKSANMKAPMRVQGVFISTEEVNAIVNRIKVESLGDDDKDNLKPSDAILDTVESQGSSVEQFGGIDPASITEFTSPEDNSDEALAVEAIKIIMRTEKASASYLQRSMRLGYARAARLIDILSERAWLGEANGSKPRDILYSNIPEHIKNQVNADTDDSGVEISI